MDYSKPGRWSAGAFEEPSFGRGVVLDCSVKVQMIPRQVCKDRRMELKAVNAAQLQGVRGDFESGVATAAVQQLGKESDKVQRFRRRVGCGPVFAGYGLLNGAERRGCETSRPQNRINQVDGCGFAVRAGHSCQAQPPIGMTVKVEGRQSEGFPPMANLYPGNRFGKRAAGGRPFADDSRRAPGDGLGDKLMAVYVFPRESEKNLARLQFPGVIL